MDTETNAFTPKGPTPEERMKAVFPQGSLPPVADLKDIPQAYSEKGNDENSGDTLAEFRQSVFLKTGNIADVGRDWLSVAPPAPEWILDGVFESRRLIMLTGPSKARKSYFVLQMGLCFSAGVPFLGRNVTTPQKVLLLNLENDADWQWRRVHRMADTLRIRPGDVSGNFITANLRGKPFGVGDIGPLVEAYRPQIVIADPLYKLDDGADECDQVERKELISELTGICETEKLSLVLTHHDGKGNAGDRDTRDRGSGSSIINRAVDATMTLTLWGDPDDPDADSLSVLECLPRYAPPPQPQTIVFRDGAFFTDSRQPVKKTSLTLKAAGNLPGPKPSGDQKTDAQKLGKRIISTGQLQNMTSVKLQASTLFNGEARRAKRAYEFIKANPADCGVCYAHNNSTNEGRMGEPAKVEDFAAQNKGYTLKK